MGKLINSFKAGFDFSGNTTVKYPQFAVHVNPADDQVDSLCIGTTYDDVYGVQLIPELTTTKKEHITETICRFVLGLIQQTHPITNFVFTAIGGGVICRGAKEVYEACSVFKRDLKGDDIAPSACKECYKKFALGVTVGTCYKYLATFTIQFGVVPVVIAAAASMLVPVVGGPVMAIICGGIIGSVVGTMTYHFVARVAPKVAIGAATALNWAFNACRSRFSRGAAPSALPAEKDGLVSRVPSSVSSEARRDATVPAPLGSGGGQVTSLSQLENIDEDSLQPSSLRHQPS